MNTVAADPLAALREIAPAAIDDGAGALQLYSHDVYATGPAPRAVFRPATVEELAQGVAAATAAGLAVIPRGGGMSYTGGYLSPTPDFILVDTAGLDRIVAIDEADMTVTVECGVTWDALRRALQPRGLRVKAWGTLSGVNATVGGGMSQNGVFWGAADGSVVDSALSFDVVLADGTTVSTGSGFFRPYGPDLTGLFAADCGALGIKARATLRLVREGQGLAYGSFAFDDAAAFFAGLSAVAREGLAAESFGFDPFLQAQRMKRDSLAADAKSLVGMMKAQGSLLKGVKEGARVALAGRSFLDGVPFSLHCIAERRRQSEADADMAEIARLVTQAGGRAVENTIPKILRANPFPPVNSMVGPAGERWVPVHGFLPHSRLVEGWDAIQALFAAHRAEMEGLGVQAGAMLAAVSPQACLIEPVFYWPDALNPLHRHAVEAGHLAKLKGFPANPDSAALVDRLRKGVIEVFATLGAIHLQIARTYPLKASHDPAAWALLETVKRQLDPRGLMNPGSLAL
ncbi:FAD-binding oxidoreductase [Novosphingobium sp. Gsoil 351]|uniref:FAD-binding oxidoreductase n=1 Tax=Novosphingobium sp. Gsoil 351 TaxID=2675225 RepID=UPI0012B4BF6F|nr:FAD-binding oxidoreductase [Novosphingobium sp. Gsoil 351]QGN54438.1 FAD-binding protein [Novosphingobium sp. Gsoil 351]